MALRYIEFIKVDGKVVTLEIVQVSLKESSRCFHIGVQADNKFQFVVCKDSKNEWKIITQEFIEFIIVKLFGHITTSIEKRLLQERDYLNLN